MQSTASVVSVNNFDIENFVSEATWRDVLFDLVKKNELNPWEIDIVNIVEKYVEVVKGMKVLDLRVPANIILAASILLRLKSDMLEIEERQEVAEALEEAGRTPVQVDPLSLRLRLPPKRRVTLVELVDALEEAMKLKEYREVKATPEIVKFPLVFNKVDMEQEIERTYALVKQHLDKSKMLTFSTLCQFAEKDNALLGVFIPLLFLASKNRVILVQDEFFGEIVIALN